MDKISKARLEAYRKKQLEEMSKTIQKMKFSFVMRQLDAQKKPVENSPICDRLAKKQDIDTRVRPQKRLHPSDDKSEEPVCKKTKTEQTIDTRPRMPQKRAHPSDHKSEEPVCKDTKIELPITPPQIIAQRKEDPSTIKKAVQQACDILTCKPIIGIQTCDLVRKCISKNPLSFLRPDSQEITPPELLKKPVKSSKPPESFLPFIHAHHSKENFKHYSINTRNIVVKIKFGETYGILKFPRILKEKSGRSQNKSLLKFFSHDNSCEYIEDEITMYKKLNNEHPNITKFLHFYHDPAPALLLEYCDTDLYRYSRSHNPDIPFFLALSLQITDALEFIHKKDIIHRDIKHTNILVCFSGKKNKIIFKVCDFETAIIRPFDPHELYKIGKNGTPGFLPPESETLSRYYYTNHSMDIYAFGLTIQRSRSSSWEKCTGNMELLKEKIEDSISLALQTDIKKRITAKKWNTFLKKEALPFLSEQQKNEYGLPITLDH